MHTHTYVCQIPVSQLQLWRWRWRWLRRNNSKYDLIQNDRCLLSKKGFVWLTDWLTPMVNWQRLHVPMTACREEKEEEEEGKEKEKERHKCQSKFSSSQLRVCMYPTCKRRPIKQGVSKNCNNIQLLELERTRNISSILRCTVVPIVSKKVATFAYPCTRTMYVCVYLHGHSMVL